MTDVEASGPDLDRPQRRGWRWLLGNVVVPAVFVAAVAAVVVARWEDLAAVFEEPGAELAWIGVLILVGHSLNSAQFWVMYRAQGVPIGLWENWMMFGAGQLGNLLPGQAGTLYRFRYLKAVHSFSYSRSSSTFGANLVVTCASSAVAGLIGLGGVAITGGSVRPWIVGVFAALAVGSILLVRLPLPHVRWLRGTPARVWAAFREGWESLRGQPQVALQVLVLDLVKYVLVAIRFQLSFSLLGVEETIWYFLVIAPAAGLAGALSFTPGGLGIREAFVTAAAVGMGSEFDTGLLAATVDRGVMLAAAVALGGIGLAYTYPLMRAAAATGET